MGSAYFKRETLYLAVATPGGARERWLGRCLDEFPPPQGVALTLDWGRKAAAYLEMRWVSKQWDPYAVKPTTKPAAAAPPQTVGEWCAAWVAQQTYESAKTDTSAVQLYLLPSPLGRAPLARATAADALDWLVWLKKCSSRKGGTLAPRTIRNAANVARRALEDAVARGVLTANPLAALRGKLPAIEDKDPTARATWCLSRETVVALCTSPKLAPDVRLCNALELLTGCRFGEMAAMRWRDWDRTTQPLSRLTITRAIKSVSKTEGRTKTGARKLVPVHPDLQRLLAAWWESGWKATYGRAPTPDDLVVPKAGAPTTPRKGTAQSKEFPNWCELVGAPRLHQHAARHSWITLVQEDGGDGTVLRWVTHAPPRDSWSNYTRVQWQRLCAEVAKLSLPFVSATPSATQLEGETRKASISTGLMQRAQKDSNL